MVVGKEDDEAVEVKKDNKLVDEDDKDQGEEDNPSNIPESPKSRKNPGESSINESILPPINQSHNSRIYFGDVV